MDKLAFLSEMEKYIKVIIDEAKGIIDNPDNYSSEKVASSYILLAIVSINMVQCDENILRDVDEENLPNYQKAKEYLEAAKPSAITTLRKLLPVDILSRSILALLSKQNYGGGDSGTAFALGIVYAHGIGVEKDLQRAAHFFARNILDECRLYTYSSLYEIAKLQH
ncbi:hypothetical protein TrispH2_009446 [Trichoplax sp. H2]|nr:hypothetical protein TrispH2_009446 [Trichoplax sp. H2]|eukprot:RDD38846.1 hypothetical protein TrispH2_009446 [Trichoplax sp. H2]